MSLPAFWHERCFMALGNVRREYPWSLIIGLLVGLVSKGIVSPEMKLLLVTGFCGGFTTFSTFANESFGIMKAGDALQMALYVGASVVVGILAVWAGIMLSNSFK